MRAIEIKERKRFYAFVEGVSPALVGNSYSRSSILLDCIDSTTFSPDQVGHETELALVRIMTTPAVLTNRFRLSATPKEGDWLVIELDGGVRGPLAWVLRATGSYSGPASETRLAGVASLSTDGPDVVPPPWAGLNLGNISHSAQALAAFCRISSNADPKAAEARLALTNLSGLYVRAVDVGQASCNALHLEKRTDAPILAFFDVGAPVFWNENSLRDRTALRTMQLDPACIVMLSHWDFDHYALVYRELSALRQHRWFAPEQPVGPNAAALQRSLGDRLGFIRSPTVGISGSAVLHRGQGPANDRNGSGYILRLDDRTDPRVLTGDVSYSLIPPSALLSAKRITVPHHGGPDIAPPPAGGGRAVASVGIPNCYRHPCPNVFASHHAAGWAIETTAGMSGISRGDRWL